MPCTQCGCNTHEPEGLQVLAVTNEEMIGALQECSSKELGELQLSDLTAGPILQAMEAGIKPNPRETQGYAPKLAGYYNCGVGWS